MLEIVKTLWSLAGKMRIFHRCGAHITLAAAKAAIHRVVAEIMMSL